MRRVALVAGPLALLFAVLVPAPGALEESAWRVAGLAAWMAAWWLTAVVPLPATALLPLAALPVLDIDGFSAVAVSYADPVIFLFLGGFLLAATLERWELHARFATSVLRLVGLDPRRMVLAFLLVSAFASMWISNTATAVMMLPIAAAVAGSGARGIDGSTDRGERSDGPTARQSAQFPTALMLAVAYGASIGGVTTLIGTPPNAILAANARELIGREITFAGWLPIGLAVALPMLLLCWGVLLVMFKVKAAGERGDAAAPQPLDRSTALDLGDRFVLGVFVMTACAWILRTPKAIGNVRIPGLTDVVPGLSDAGIAILASLVVLSVPLPRARYRVALDWQTARGIPWGILLLFGGGLALAGAFESSGLSAWVAQRLTALRGLPLPVVTLATAALFVFLTELTSNTATSALGIPLMAGVAGGLGVAPLPVMATAALAASMAFMLPVATPPNAIVFGKGHIAIRDMARAGLVLNVMAILTITVVVSLLV